jgi:hypothetical protein
LYSHDGFFKAVFYAKRLTGAIPRPDQDPGQITEFVYTEIKNLCEENNSRMIIVVLTEPGLSRRPSPDEISKLTGMGAIVNTEPALLARLPVKDFKSYGHAYHLYRGEKPILVDKHPNENAHQIIAEEILKAIKNLSPPTEK